MPKLLFLPSRDCSIDGLRAITYPYWRIGDFTDFKFQKSPLCYTYENKRIPNFALFIRFHKANEKEPLSSKSERILLIQESSESDSEVVKVKKKKEKTSYDTQIVGIKEQFT